MKAHSNPFRRPASLVVAITFAFSALPALAAPLYWDGTSTTANADGGSGTWNTTTTNWDTAATGGADSAWSTANNTNIANFGGTGGTVTLGSDMGPSGAYPNAINVTAGNYVFDLNSLGLAWRGAGLVISSGATLTIQNGTVTILNAGFSVTGTNALTISAKVTEATAGTNFSKSGAGDITLTNNANDFTGKLSGQNGGTVSFSSIKNSGVASAVGAGSLLETGNNNTMAYTGTGDSTNRTFGVFGGGSDTLKNNGSGALVWTGAFSNTKSGPSTLNFGGTNALDNEFQGALIDSTAGGHILSVSKADAGAWKLSGNSSFTGATSVSAGTLIVGHANALGSTVGSTSVTSNAQLILTGGIAVGAEALTLNSGATASWNGQTGAALRNYSGTNSWAGTIALGQNTSIAANSGSSLTVSGAISGGFNLTKADSGTLTLSGANIYTGTTTIAAGTLQADRADVAAVSGALGNGGAISFTGGTLQYSANSAGTNYSARILNSTTAAIKLDTNGQNVTFGTALSSTNTAGLTKEGAGQLELKMSATAQYTGTTTINGGTLKFAGAVDLDGISSSSININNGASLVIYSDFNRTTLSNSKTFTFGSTGGGSIVYDKGNHLWQSSTGKFVTTGGTQNTISTANGGFINPQNSNTVNFDVADGTDAVDLLVSVSIGSGNYTKSGAGTLSITSFSTLGGGAAQPNLTINGGTFDVGGAARLTTVGQSTGVVTSDILNNGVYRHSSSGAQTLGGVMSGTGALTQNGAGTLTLSGTNTYTGATNVNVGNLTIAGNQTGATQIVVSNNGSILQFGDGTSTNGSSVNSGTIFVNNSGTVQINKADGGTVTNAIASNPSATTTLSGSNAAGTTNTFTATSFNNGGGFATNSTNAGAVLAFSGSSGAIDLKGTNITVGGAGNTLFTSAGQGLYSSTTASNVTKAGTGTLIYQGNQGYTGTTGIDAGAIRVDTAQTNSGTYFVGNGGTTATAASLFLGGGAAGLTGGVSFNRSVSTNAGSSGNRVIGGTNTSGTNTYQGTVTVTDNNVTLQAATGGTVAFNTLTGASLRTLAVGTGGSTGTVRMDGTADNVNVAATVNFGTLELNKTSTASVHALGGLLTVNSGGTAILSGSGGDQIFNSASATVNSGGVLNLNGQSETVNALSLSGSGISSGGALINNNGATTSTITATGGIALAANTSIGGSANISVASAISGSSLGLSKVGTGTVTLSGTNTYTGQTTISNGTLQIGAGGTTGKLSASSAIVNDSNLTINRSDVAVQGTDFSGAAITGTGSLTAAGAGTTTLNAANAYSGGTTVNAGADLRINGAQTGVGTVTVVATGKLGGSGSVIGGINVSGVLAPGNSIESFGTGALSFTTGSNYAYEFQSLGLNGDLTYSSSTLSIAAGTILTLAELGGTTALANGSKLTLISSVGAWNGGLFTYGGSSLADDSNITLGANIWRFNYNDTLAGSNFTGDITGATNYVTLTVVPEPNVAALCGGLGTLLLLRRRR